MNNRSGFTIVEILVVVVIISILLGMTYFFIGDWRIRTANTTVKNDVSQAKIALDNYKNFNNGYPTTLDGLYKPSNDVTMTYTLRADGTFCLLGRHKRVPNIWWSVNTRIKPYLGVYNSTCQP